MLVALYKVRKALSLSGIIPGLFASLELNVSYANPVITVNLIFFLNVELNMLHANSVVINEFDFEKRSVLCS